MYQRHRSERNRSECGQTLVLVALALVPLLLVVGLVIDGGWAFANQRRTQNALDAAADAGAVMLVQNLPFQVQGQSGPNTDAMVLAEVLRVVHENEPDLVVTPDPVYTDIKGVSIGKLVGAEGSNPPPREAYGVQVGGSLDFGTFFAQIRGMTGFTASAKATAIAGSINHICATDEPCRFIPVTFPTVFSICGSNNKIIMGTGPYAPIDNPTSGNITTLPLCGLADGNVGWLDLEPPNPNCNGGGAQELACVINNPSNDAIDLPAWIGARTGNINSSDVQEALDKLIGPTIDFYEPGQDQIVQIPLYNCIDNNVDQPSHEVPCPKPPVRSGVGENTSYHVVAIAAMILDKAWINGNRSDICNNVGGGTGATSCLRGWITSITETGTVGVPNAGTQGTVWGTQLIK